RASPEAEEAPLGTELLCLAGVGLQTEGMNGAGGNGSVRREHLIRLHQSSFPSARVRKRHGFADSARLCFPSHYAKRCFPSQIQIYCLPSSETLTYHCQLSKGFPHQNCQNEGHKKVCGENSPKCDIYLEREKGEVPCWRASNV